MDSATNKTALITGGSSGIGLALSELFARDGYRIILVALEQSGLAQAEQRLRDNYSVEVVTLQKNLVERAAPRAIYEFVQTRGLTVDVLVNSAGFGSFGFFDGTDLDKEYDMILVNCAALVSLTKLFFRDMLQRDEGEILNIASVIALQPNAMFATYGASKSFVHNFSLALNYEARLKHSRVTVTTVCPPPRAPTLLRSQRWWAIAPSTTLRRWMPMR